MKKVFIPLLIIFISATNLNAELSEFEKKVLLFRYSLNEDLTNSSYEEMRDFKFPDKVTERITSFLEENSKEIKKYKLQKLNENKVKKIIKPDENYIIQKSSSNEFFDIFDSQLKEIQIPVFRFVNINPLTMPVYFSTFYISSISTMEVARYSIKMQVASPLIKCEKIGASKWNISYDNYDYIFIFEYDTDADTYRILEIYHRKK